MSVTEEKFKFDESGFSCTKIKGIIPYERFVSITRFKGEYEISYEIQKDKIKFILNSTYIKNIGIIGALILLSILFGFFSYKKDNIIYQYNLNKTW